MQRFKWIKNLIYVEMSINEKFEMNVKLLHILDELLTKQKGEKRVKFQKESNVLPRLDNNFHII